jgi:hypothetical protein
MEDKRHGAKANSGRLKKDDVLSLIDSMDAIAVPDSIWKALYNKARDGDTNYKKHGYNIVLVCLSKQ